MIKYSKFTDHIGSGNFTDKYFQNTDNFEISVGGGVAPHTYQLAWHALGENMFKVDNKDTRTTPVVSFWCLYY